MSVIPDEQTHPDIININLDEKTDIKTIGKLLAYLDREVTGYEYEEYDENGDNPEVYFSDPSIDGYSFDYNAFRYPSLTIYMKRNKPEILNKEWRQWLFRLGTYDLKIISAYAYRICLEGTGKYNPVWDSITRGKVPRLSWGFDGIRGIFGVDLGKQEDVKLMMEWIKYIFDNYQSPTETDYYKFTGSLGHD